MTVDPELLAERSASTLAHLDRVAAHLPEDPRDLEPMSSATDTVVLHLWQAIQIVIDLAMSAAGSAARPPTVTPSDSSPRPGSSIRSSPNALPARPPSGT